MEVDSQRSHWRESQGGVPVLGDAPSAPMGLVELLQTQEDLRGETEEAKVKAWQLEGERKLEGK